MHWTDYTTEQQLRAALVQHARGYVGVRYRHQGRTRELGVDCLGLLIACARDFQFDFHLEENTEGPNDHNYSMDPNGYYMVDRLREEMVEIPDWREALPGDVVVVRWHIERPPQHLGIVSTIEPDNLVCVHAPRKGRHVCETRWDREDLITNAFRIREIAQLAGSVNLG